MTDAIKNQSQTPVDGFVSMILFSTFPFIPEESKQDGIGDSKMQRIDNDIFSNFIVCANVFWPKLSLAECVIRLHTKYGGI